jgi:hypothetical protein
MKVEDQKHDSMTSMTAASFGGFPLKNKFPMGSGLRL